MKKTTEVAVVPEPPVQRAKVIWAGKEVEPIKTGITSVHGIIEVDGITLLIDEDGWVDGQEFSLFKLEADDTLHVLADKDSFFEIDSRWFGDNNNDLNLVVLMESVVNDCNFINTNVLTKVNAQKTTFIGSRIHLPSSLISESRIERSTIVSSSVPSGVYVDCQISYSQMFPLGSVTLDGCEFRSTRLFGKTLRCKDCTLRECFIKVQDQFFANDFKAFDQLLMGYENVYLMSRFDIARIELPGDIFVSMVRIDKDRISLNIEDRPTAPKPYPQMDLKHIMTVNFSNAEYDHPDLMDGICKALYDVDTPDNPIRDSVCKYLATTVISRCGIIQLLDSTRGLITGSSIKDNLKVIERVEHHDEGYA